MQQALSIASVNLVLVFRREAQPLDDPDRLTAVETRGGLKRNVGREDYLIHTEEIETAPSAGERAE